jgi:major vault protein
MAEVAGREKRDLVLAEGEFAYMQDVTKGIIKVYNGPTVINPSAQEVPIRYNAEAATFERCETLEEAKRQHFLAPEGFYCVLLNPAKNGQQPVSGQTKAADELAVGRKVVIPGPAQFALWPGQKADLVRGHHLRSNQYLLVRVYNEDEAKKNWGSAVIKPAAQVVNTDGMSPKQAEEAQKKAAEEAKNQPSKKSAPPADLTVGKLLVIRGTEVSFYIPPTGITVVKDEEISNTSKATYVREALTLERLE